MYALHQTFDNLEGLPTEETFYFDLTEEEGIQLQYSREEGFAEYAQRILATQDPAKIMPLMRDLLLKAYGEKDEDGIHFNKSPEISQRFSRHVAFSQIYVKLATDADLAAEFFNGIVPAEEKMISAQAAKRLQPTDRQRSRRPRPGERIVESVPLPEPGNVGNEAPVAPDVVADERRMEDYTPMEFLKLDNETKKRLMADFEERNPDYNK